MKLSYMIPDVPSLPFHLPTIKIILATELKIFYADSIYTFAFSDYDGRCGSAVIYQCEVWR